MSREDRALQVAAATLRPCDVFLRWGVAARCGAERRTAPKDAATAASWTRRVECLAGQEEKDSRNGTVLELAGGALHEQHHGENTAVVFTSCGREMGRS